MQKVKEILSFIREFIQLVWDWLPKEAKVAAYIFFAAILERVASTLTADALNFIPLIYRVSIFNFIIVLLVEFAKRLRAKPE